MVYILFTDLNRTLTEGNNHLIQNPSSNNNKFNGLPYTKPIGSTSKSKAPIAIQIEVDIDPPANENKDLSEEQLMRLGLPAHHVHYTSRNVNKQLTPGHEELLAPSDIKVTYSEERENSGKHDRLNQIQSETGNEQDAYDNYEAFNSAVFGTPEPPRALPSMGKFVYFFLIYQELSVYLFRTIAM